MKRACHLVALALFTVAASGVGAQSPSPYLAAQDRPIRALAPDRQAGLLAGAGLGYAMAAELNGHAGPKHVLELADDLELTAEQRTAVQASFDRMHATAVTLGAELVAAEEELDRRFAHRHLDEAKLAELTARIGELEGRLRYACLGAHLETDALPTGERRTPDAEPRGYASGADSEHRGPARHEGH